MISTTKIAHLNTNWPNGFESQTGTELGRTKNILRATYSFAVNGGAIGATSLKDVEGNDAILPDNAIITNVVIDTITTPTSAGLATIALNSEAAGDLKAALAIASYTGIIAGIPINTAATAVKLSADRTIQATIAAFVLTAGQFHVFVEYILST